MWALKELYGRNPKNYEVHTFSNTLIDNVISETNDDVYGNTLTSVDNYFMPIWSDLQTQLDSISDSDGEDEYWYVDNLNEKIPITVYQVYQTILNNLKS